MYSQLFNWIVKKIKKFLVSESKANLFNNVLDIFGFEKIDINFFEQFCINYANEKLQQQFCERNYEIEKCNRDTDELMSDLSFFLYSSFRLFINF